MKLKRTCREVFHDQLKLHLLFLGIVVGRFKWEKWGDHQKKKLFINNAFEAQILFKENHQGLMRLHVHLGRTSIVRKNWYCLQKKEFFLKRKNYVLQNLLKHCLSFGGSFESYNLEKGALWESCATLYVWGSYKNCWIHLAEYLVDPLVLPHVE